LRSKFGTIILAADSCFSVPLLRTWRCIHVLFKLLSLPEGEGEGVKSSGVFYLAEGTNSNLRP